MPFTFLTDDERDQLTSDQQKFFTPKFMDAIAQGTVSAEQVTALDKAFKANASTNPADKNIVAVKIFLKKIKNLTISDDNFNKFKKQMLQAQEQDLTAAMRWDDGGRLGQSLVAYQEAERERDQKTEKLLKLGEQKKEEMDQAADL